MYIRSLRKHKAATAVKAYAATRHLIMGLFHFEHNRRARLSAQALQGSRAITSATHSRVDGKMLDIGQVGPLPTRDETHPPAVVTQQPQGKYRVFTQHRDNLLKWPTFIGRERTQVETFDIRERLFIGSGYNFQVQHRRRINMRKSPSTKGHSPSVLVRQGVFSVDLMQQR